MMNPLKDDQQKLSNLKNEDSETKAEPDETMSEKLQMVSSDLKTEIHDGIETIKKEVKQGVRHGLQKVRKLTGTDSLTADAKDKVDDIEDSIQEKANQLKK